MFAIRIFACLLASAWLTPAQVSPTGPPTSTSGSGPYWTTWQTTVSVTNPVSGQVSQQTQGCTLLGDGLNYWVPDASAAEL